LAASSRGFASFYLRFSIVLALSAAYVAFGALPTMRSAFYGIGPVVVGIFAVSVYRLGKAAIKKHSQIAIGVAAAGVMRAHTRNGEALVIFQFDLLHVDGEDPSAASFIPFLYLFSDQRLQSPPSTIVDLKQLDFIPWYL